MCGQINGGPILEEHNERINSEQKRSSRIILTTEALVLKQMRLTLGLSMKKAGALIGKSDSYIAHLETGRMDLPRGEKLDRLLMAYGGIKQKSFFEKVRNYHARPNDKTLLLQLIDRANEQQLIKIKKHIEALLAGVI